MLKITILITNNCYNNTNEDSYSNTNDEEGEYSENQDQIELMKDGHKKKITCCKCKQILPYPCNYCINCGNKINLFLIDGSHSSSFSELSSVFVEFESISSTSESDSPRIFITPRHSFQSIPAPFVPEKAKIGGTLTSSLFWIQIKQPKDFNPNHLVIEECSEQSALSVGSNPRDLRGKPMVSILSCCFPKEVYEKFGENIFKAINGRRDPTYTRNIDYVRHSSNIILEVQGNCAIFTDADFKPCVMFTVTTMIRPLGLNDIDQLGRTLFPRIEVLDD